MSNIIKHEYGISQVDRNRQNGHKSFVLWFTGLSGSGKSTIANELEKSLFRRNIRVYSLDGDNIRCGLNNELSFSEKDRRENLRRIAEVGKLFVDAGMVAIAAFISPLKKDRNLARRIIGEENFVEIFVNTPLEICERRDVKGLYQKAREGKISDFTGIDASYEIPENPAIEIKTEEEPLQESVKRITEELENKLQLL